MELMMPENSKNDRKHSQKADFQEEAQIVEIIKIFWQWKYIILLGTFAICILTAIISYSSEKMYRVEMILSPGIIGLDNSGRAIYIDKPSNIRSLITSGLFNKQIAALLKEKKISNIPNRFDFIVIILTKGPNPILKIAYESSEIDKGKAVLNYLFSLIEQTYSESIRLLKNKSEVLLLAKKVELKNLRALEKSNNVSLTYFKERIQELSKEMNLIKKNTEIIAETGAKAISENSGESNALLSSLVYSNAIQQSQILLSSHSDEIKQYEIKIVEIKEVLNVLKDNIPNKIAEIKIEESLINNMHGVKMVQQPLSSQKPVKPKPPTTSIRFPSQLVAVWPHLSWIISTSCGNLKNWRAWE